MVPEPPLKWGTSGASGGPPLQQRMELDTPLVPHHWASGYVQLRGVQAPHTRPGELLTTSQTLSITLCTAAHSCSVQGGRPPRGGGLQTSHLAGLGDKQCPAQPWSAALSHPAAQEPSLWGCVRGAVFSWVSLGPPQRSLPTQEPACCWRFGGNSPTSPCPYPMGVVRA